MRPATRILLVACLTMSACTTTPALWNRYQSYPEHKAFAVGVNDVSGAAWSAATAEEAMHMANSYCVANGGIGCEVIDVNGSPPGMLLPAPAQTGPQSGEASQVAGTGGSVRYECYTYVGSNHVLTLPVAPLDSDVGMVTVTFHGDPMGATYLQSGLTQTWIFENNLYVELDPDFTAAYYDFRGAEVGEKRKPEAVFECKKNRR